MKMIILKRTYIIIFTMFISYFGYTQNNTISKIVYKKMFEKIEKKDDKNIIATDFMTKIVKQLEKIEYTLFFNNVESIFECKDNMLRDNENSFIHEFAKSIGGGGSIIYINNNSKKKIEKRDISGDSYLINTKLESKWVLINEHKRIGKYICYKATSKIEQETVRGTINKDIIAWYTEDIAFPFGPNGFGELPGLILEIKIGKFSFYAQSIELNFTPSFNIAIPENGIEVTEKELENIEKKGFKRFKKNK